MTQRFALAKTRDIGCADAFRMWACPDGEKRRVQILRPFVVMSSHSYSAPVSPPIGPAYLAATLEKAGYQVGMIDAVGEAIGEVRTSGCGQFNLQGLNVEAIIARLEPDTAILGVSMMFSQEWPQHRDLVRAIKQVRPDLIIVGGGEHATALPEFILNDCPEIEFLVAGEGELTFLELVHTLQNFEPANMFEQRVYDILARGQSVRDTTGISAKYSLPAVSGRVVGHDGPQ